MPRSEVPLEAVWPATSRAGHRWRTKERKCAEVDRHFSFGASSMVHRVARNGDRAADLRTRENTERNRRDQLIKNIFSLLVLGAPLYQSASPITGENNRIENGGKGIVGMHTLPDGNERL